MSTELNLETITQGKTCGMKGRLRQDFVIDTEQAWSDFYRSLVSNAFPTPATPRIDFDKYTVLAVLMGQKPSGGYSTEIAQVVQSGNDAEVYVQESSAGGKSATVMTQPYHVVKVPKIEGKVEFKYL